MIEDILKKFSAFQYKNKYLLLILIFIITIILGTGIKDLGVESDIEEGMPQHLPIYQLNEKITQEFGGEDVIFVLLQLDDTLNTRETSDIRSPQVVDFLIKLEESLSDEVKIESINSAGTILKNKEISEKKDIINAQEKYPQLNTYFSDDYKSTILYIRGDIGKGYQEVKSFENLIDEKISSINQPGGVEITISGTPSLSKKIYEFLISDAINTLLIAAALILLMLFVMEKSFIRGFLIFTPLTFGLVWTMGTLGHLGIKLSVVTVGLGAIIIGLGVEYGAFMVTRYKEERKKGHSQKDALANTVSNIGKAIMGSGTTTIIGFLALTFSILPMMQKLGSSLAIGIFYSILAAVLVSPILLLIQENLEEFLNNRKYEKLKSQKGGE